MIENARLFASDSLLYGGGRSQRTTAMHGKLALYHPQYGVIPIAVSLLAIIWTTIFLTWLQTYLVADDVEDLALAYLLPTIFIGTLSKADQAFCPRSWPALAQHVRVPESSRARTRQTRPSSETWPFLQVSWCRDLADAGIGRWGGWQRSLPLHFNNWAPKT